MRTGHDSSLQRFIWINFIRCFKVCQNCRTCGFLLDIIFTHNICDADFTLSLCVKSSSAVVCVISNPFCFLLTLLLLMMPLLLMLLLTLLLTLLLMLLLVILLQNIPLSSLPVHSKHLVGSSPQLRVGISVEPSMLNTRSDADSDSVSRAQKVEKAETGIQVFLISDQFGSFFMVNHAPNV